MTSLKNFRNEIIIYGLVMAAVAEVISLFIIGPSVMFAGGLITGTAVSIIGFIILVKTGETLMEESKKSPILLGYVVRLLLYGVTFFVCIRIGLQCGFGCGLGFITIHFGIMFLYGIVYKLIKKKKNPLNDWTEPKQWNDLSIYDDEDDEWPRPEDRIGSPEYKAAHPENDPEEQDAGDERAE